MVRKKKNHRCSQNFGFGGFNHTYALCAQPVLANLGLFWPKGALVKWLLYFSVSVFVSVFDIAPHPWIVKDMCFCSALMKTLK